MHTCLVNYIEQHARTKLTREEVRLISELFIEKQLRKKQYLLQENEVCNYLGFIVKGALRQYYTDDKGRQHIVALMLENWWAGDRESYFKRTPSIYNIQAWEDTELLLLHIKDLEKTNHIRPFVEMRIKLDENYSIAAQKRLLSANTFPADKRYEELAANYPAFSQRFPQHIIASYLGITKETLSRIRNQLARK